MTNTPGKPSVHTRPILAGQLKSAETPTVASATVFGGPDKAGGTFEGLVYRIPNTTKSLPDFAAIRPSAKLYTKTFEVASQDFSQGFPNALTQSTFFAVRYEGTFTVAVSGSYDLRLVSDDGARVRIGNIPVIQNDGVHEAAEKFGNINLAAGTHTLVLEYFQADKKVALQLFVTPPGGQERPFSSAL
jgi:hypothetical protein